MSLYAQPLLDIHGELIVDLFAGGGGASSGIEEATGRMVDIAINHNAQAVSLHEANHPQTRHYVSDVFEIDPRVVTAGRPVGFLWASPDCTYHSKARGAKPIRSGSKKRRALAWVVTRWAGTVRPRVIMLENVEEFAQWGPLIGEPDQLKPCPRRRGRTFRRWVRTLQQMGYEVQWRELRACDYGAPTIRKRLFLIARCDGQPIVWPEPTHGPKPGLKPWRTAAECIDWSIPMCSVFATKEEARAWGKHYGQAAPIRPLAENTMSRVGRGVKRFVLDNPKPYLVTIAHGDGGGVRWGDGTRDIGLPLNTLTTKNAHAVVAPVFQTCNNSRQPHYGPTEPAHTIVADGAAHSVVAANLVAYHDERGGGARANAIDAPVSTLDCANRVGLVATFLTQNNGGFNEQQGRSVADPLSTVLCNSRGHHGLIAAHIQRDFGTSTGHAADQPLGTITTEGQGKSALVASFLSKFYGQGVGQALGEPVHTIPTLDRFGLVTVTIGGEPYVISDIAMRMLQPRELYLAQGFRPGYIIDRGADGTPITKTEQVRMVGNSVSPPVAAALVRANAEDLIARPQPKARRMA